jgi:monoterpene epsilon-lactone hydrolase
MSWFAIPIVLFIIFWLVARLYLKGEDLSSYEQPIVSAQNAGKTASSAHDIVVQHFTEIDGSAGDSSRKERFFASRKRMDDFGAQCDLDGVNVLPVDIGGLAAEWVIADGADHDCRILYLHGGAFTLGSPLSHRAITSRFSRTIGASVLAIDYRLMPENQRIDSVDDCQSAYRWILENGPQGPAPLNSLVVAGDSAGGNLALVIIAWARDEGLRAAEAAVALSPATDGSLSGNSIQKNIATDYMLGSTFGAFAKLPSFLTLWLSLLANRMPPCDPRISPLHGDLSNLPPVLIQASTTEMLFDDAVRYVNKARAARTNATLEAWDHMLHVWHAFVSTVPEAEDGFKRIEVFLKHHVRKVDKLGETTVMARSPLA